jgi:hypothetical protein
MLLEKVGQTGTGFRTEFRHDFKQPGIKSDYFAQNFARLFRAGGAGNMGLLAGQKKSPRPLFVERPGAPAGAQAGVKAT